MKSMVYSVYKGKGGKFGSVQFRFAQPHLYKGEERDYVGEDKWEGKDGWKAREGCVFLEMASATAPDVYDWANKIVFALSVNDMSQFLLALRTGDEMSLMHDPGAGSESKGAVKKYLSFQSPKGLKAGGMLSLSQTKDEETKRHTVPLSGAEVVALGELLRTALVKSLAW